MKTMPAGEFKARCLQLIDHVQSKRTAVLITKRGKPVARLVPLEDAPGDVFDHLKGKIEILGDIVSPVVPLEDWNSLK